MTKLPPGWKYTPIEVPQYPAHLHTPRHDRASRAGDALVFLFAAAGFSLWAGYEWGWERRGDQARLDATPVPTIAACPTSNLDQDVLEHTWSHQGVVIHRECLIVSKPIYASPRYSTNRPAM